MTNGPQLSSEQLNAVWYAQQNFLKHAALELHYERLKMANAITKSIINMLNCNIFISPGLFILKASFQLLLLCKKLNKNMKKPG